MNHKVGFYVAVFTGAGVALGVATGHLPVWLGVSVGVGAALGALAAKRHRRSCAECAAAATPQPHMQNQ